MGLETKRISEMDLAALLQQAGGGMGGFGGMGAPAGGGGSLVEFRAGSMTRTGTTVTADKRKGKVRVFKGPDGVLHFAWKERNKSELELDLMLFPGDAEVFPLLRPPATGRCFALKMKSVKSIHFFWMQEPSEEKDAQLYKDMNIHLGNEVPSEEAAAPAAEATPAAAEAPDEIDPDLAAALAMSMGVDTPQASGAASTPDAPPKPPAASQPAEETPAAGDDEEEAALAAALAMSMEQPEEGDDKKADVEDDDLYDDPPAATTTAP